MRQFGLLLISLILIAAFSSCGDKDEKDTKKANTSTSGIVLMACDASFENIMEQEIEVFEYIYPDANVLSYYIDEKACIDSLLFGKARLAVVSHDLTKEQQKYLASKQRSVRTQQIAVDAIAVIVNEANPINNLSMNDISEILTGKVTKWNDLYPTKLGNIQVVFDHNGSSVVKYMTDSLLNGGQFAENVYSAETMQGVFDVVKERKDAIGFVGVSWISSDLKTADMPAAERIKTLEMNDTTATTFINDVKVLGINRNDSPIAYKPYQAYIFDGSYPLYRSIYMINTGSIGTLANGFFTFVTSFRGQKLMMSTGVLPATVHRRMVSVN
ncbi:MAG: hypothetical protein HDS68_04545 [Bacteroidales bacterium]|nr:hypothetical protein [Bacteroidales bacterium]